MSVNIYDKNENKLINVSDNFIFSKDQIDETSVFSSHNMLLDVDFFDSEFATVVKQDEKVIITFHKTENAGTWYSLTGRIKFNGRKCYKLSCNSSWDGYGRLGISKAYTSYFSTNHEYAPFGGGNSCGTNALGNWYTTYEENSILDGDNHAMSRESINDKFFRMIPTNYTTNPIDGSFWICTDEADGNNSREEFSVEIGLYEQEK